MEKKRKKLERKRKKESKTAGDKNAIRKERKCNPPSPPKQRGKKNKGKKTAQHSIFRSRRVLTGSLEFEAEWGGNGKKNEKTG